MGGGVAVAVVGELVDCDRKEWRRDESRLWSSIFKLKLVCLSMKNQ